MGKIICKIHGRTGIQLASEAIVQKIHKGVDIPEIAIVAEDDEYGLLHVLEKEELKNHLEAIDHAKPVCSKCLKYRMTEESIIELEEAWRKFNLFEK